MAIELGFTSVMMDGSLLADGKTPSDYEYNVDVTREVVEAAHAKGVSRRGRARHARRDRGRPRLGRGAPHRSRPGRRLRRADRRRRARGRDRHEPRRLQVHGEARRRRARDAPDRGDPPEAAGDAHGHARLVERPAGARRPDQRRGRQARGDLRRSGRGDPAGHPPRRAQGERRHGRPPRDHGRAARSAQREPVRVRPARVLQAGARGAEAGRASTGCGSSAPPATRATTRALARRDGRRGYAGSPVSA